MMFARGLLIFSYGLFTIAAQSLLFREFITTFEGNDISVGLFFGSWFLWVSLGAVLVYRIRAVADWILRNIEILFLSYVPGFALQALLIIQMREIAGIESYALLQIRTILFWSLLVNAPVSIITGMLFPVACRWIESIGAFAVSRVYILEAAGSFVGGLGVTLLLGAGISPARIFFFLVLILSFSVFIAQLSKALTQRAAKLQLKDFNSGADFAFGGCVISLLAVFAIVVGLASGFDHTLMNHIRSIKWTKLLPKKALLGSFNTPQAEYLYGFYQGQWVTIREGSTCDALPDKATAGQVAAIALCQRPDAKRVLVVGSGLSLCSELLRLPQIETVSWAYPDYEYVRQVNDFIPSQLRISDERFHPVTGDIRKLLAEQKQYYDIVIVNLPDATSSVLNRYYTLEFYHQVRSALRPNGIVAVRVAGGENIMGTELINLGASVKVTLEQVFSHLVLTPGEDTWFIVSDSTELTGEPGIVRKRFASIKDAGGIFRPEGLLSVYLPDRAATALESYSRADLPRSLLINRDSRPLTHLYSLLLATKQSGAPITRFVKLLSLVGPLVFLGPILIFTVLRAVYISRSSQNGDRSSFDSSFLVFSAGCVGIGVVVTLMYWYQTLFGSLYLHIGVISSLFMVGLTIGAVFTRSLLKVARVRPEIMLLAVIFIHTLILTAIAFCPAELWRPTSAAISRIGDTSHLVLAVAFILCGLCTGCYFPIAARQLADGGFDTGHAGSKLETADHLGAAVGGLVTGLGFVPVLGTKVTLYVFVVLILANVPSAAFGLKRAGKIFFLDTSKIWYRRLGYILFGIGTSIILCSNLLVAAEARLMPSLPVHAAQALAGELRIELASVVLADGGKKLTYFSVRDPNDKLTGYIFSSGDLAPEVRGFGGKMNLAVRVDTEGKIIDFHIVQSNETPAYLELLDSWQKSLFGLRLFQQQPFTGVDVVSGATVSSEAVLSALQKSGQRFSAKVLGQSWEGQLSEKAHRAYYMPDAQGIYLVAAFVVALIMTYRGGFWSRLVVLFLSFVIGGILLNAQYSTEQMVTILSLHVPAPQLSGAFLLAVAVPLLVVFFGNIYCGYICPFGAAQELLSYIVPARFKQPISTEQMQKARFVKYVFLFVLIIMFFVSRNRTTLGSDPLISIFSFQFLLPSFGFALTVVVVAALIGSLFYTRFWCRYLCPAGAFLSLFNSAILLKKYLPAKRFGKCEFGLTVKDQLDCIYCDRCRYQSPVALRKEPLAHVGILSRSLLIIAVVVAIFAASISVSRFLQVIPVRSDYVTSFAPSGGVPRDVDLQKIRMLIEQNRLSDREADFYKKVK